MKKPASRTRKIFMRVLGILIAFLVVASVGFSLWMTQSYHASDVALAALNQAQSTENNPAEYDFGDPASTTGIIIYPGASVPYEAYAPLAQTIASRGYYVAVVQMPINFAFLGVDEAGTVMERHPNISQWYLAGHSLGGVCAATYADSHSDKVAGVILFAAYSSSNLSDNNLRVLSIYGTNDQVLNKSEYDGALGNLPAGSKEVVIEGGNHGQFGSYGDQSGDGTATISPEEQWHQVADAIKDFIG